MLFLKRKKALKSSRSQLSNAFFRLKKYLNARKLWSVFPRPVETGWFETFKYFKYLIWFEGFWKNKLFDLIWFEGVWENKLFDLIWMFPIFDLIWFENSIVDLFTTLTQTDCIGKKDCYVCRDMVLLPVWGSINHRRRRMDHRDAKSILRPWERFVSLSLKLIASAKRTSFYMEIPTGEGGLRIPPGVTAVTPGPVGI